MVESPLVLWESDWINAESLARGRIAVHVTGRAVTQRTTIVSNARPGGIHSSIKDHWQQYHVQVRWRS